MLNIGVVPDRALRAESSLAIMESAWAILSEERARKSVPSITMILSIVNGITPGWCRTMMVAIEETGRARESIRTGAARSADESRDFTGEIGA
jgi:hypothetical protein